MAGLVTLGRYFLTYKSQIMKTLQIKTAVNDITNFLNCPLWVKSMKAKHDEGADIIESMPANYKAIAYKWIERIQDEYHSPIPGMDGHSAYDLNMEFLR